MAKTRCNWCRPRSHLEDSFKADVHDKAAEVDPENEMHWGHLTIGYALGKGLSPVDAQDFARHIRYHTDLG